MISDLKITNTIMKTSLSMGMLAGCPGLGAAGLLRLFEVGR